MGKTNKTGEVNGKIIMRELGRISKNDAKKLMFGRDGQPLLTKKIIQVAPGCRLIIHTNFPSNMIVRGSLKKCANRMYLDLNIFYPTENQQPVVDISSTKRIRHTG